jgi:hypothetical protein
VVEVRVEAWRVHDTGLVVAPGRFRRLPGAVRHHQGQGPAWPEVVTLVLTDDAVAVVAGGEEIERAAHREVTARTEGVGPPTSFVLTMPSGPQLLAAAPGPALAALLQALPPAG